MNFFGGSNCGEVGRDCNCGMDCPDNTILALADNIEKERKAKEAKMQAEENHGEMMSAINGLKDALISQNIINGNNHNASPSVQNNATERTMVSCCKQVLFCFHQLF